MMSHVIIYFQWIMVGFTYFSLMLFETLCMSTYCVWEVSMLGHGVRMDLTDNFCLATGPTGFRMVSAYNQPLFNMYGIICAISVFWYVVLVL